KKSRFDVGTERRDPLESLDVSIGFFRIAEPSPGSNLRSGRPRPLINADVKLTACGVRESRDRSRKFRRGDVSRLQIVEVSLRQRQHKVALIRGDVFDSEHTSILRYVTVF